MRDRLGAKPDELVDPDRPQRELFVSGVGGQRRGAVNDHWAGHRVVGAAPGDDAPTCCRDVAVPGRRFAEGERKNNATMMKMMAAIPPADREAMARYLSGL